MQNLVQKIAEYGKEYRTIDGMTMEDTHFMGFRNMKVVSDFKVLEKGCETWIEGEKYPMRLCVEGTRLITVVQFKKLIPIIADTIRGNIFNKFIALLYLNKNWKSYLDFIYMGMRDVYYPEVKFYSQPVREVYRVLSDLNIDKMRDVICAILEFDTAYRYRFQDIIGELNKERFEEDPIEEIERLAGLLFKREKDTNMDMVKKILPYVLFYLKINKKLVKVLKDIISKVDINEIKLSIEDIYWVFSAYKDYDFTGLSYQERQNKYNQMKI